MSKETLTFFLGILVFITPFLGIPDAWKFYVLVGAGALLVICGYLLRRAAYYRDTDRGNGERSTDSFHESRGRKTKLQDVTSYSIDTDSIQVESDLVR